MNTRAEGAATRLKQVGVQAMFPGEQAVRRFRELYGGIDSLTSTFLQLTAR